jgi:hypothetical protein
MSFRFLEAYNQLLTLLCNACKQSALFPAKPKRGKTSVAMLGCVTASTPTILFNCYLNNKFSYLA